MRDHWRWCRLASGGFPPSPCPCSLVSEEVRLLSAEWLLVNQLDHLLPYQELPSAAFLDPHEVEWAYLVSHRWHSQVHPDISGRQLLLALSKIWCIPGRRTGIWYDFCCLPQDERTPEEQETFQRGLTQLPGLIGSTLPVFVLEEGLDYASRGWCVAETSGHYYLHSAGQAASLSRLLASYPWLGKGPARLQDVRVGYRPGIHKLNEWLCDHPSSLTHGSVEHIAAIDESNRMASRAARVCFAIDSLRDKGALDDDLLAIAKRYSVTCTQHRDILTCMRVIETLGRFRQPANDR